MRKIRFVFVLVAALCSGELPAIPLLPGPAPMAAGAAQEVVALRRYAEVVASTADAQAPQPVLGGTSPAAPLLTLLSQPPANDTRDPREFGFDPTQSWRAARAAPDQRAAGRPSPARGAQATSAGDSIRERLKRYFKSARDAFSEPEDAASPNAAPVYRDDPVHMALGTSILGANLDIDSLSRPFVVAALRPASHAPASLVESFDVASGTGGGIGDRPSREQIVGGLGSLVQATGSQPASPASAPSGAQADSSAPDGLVFYRESQPVSLREFAARVFTAIFATPWLYLGLGVLAVAKLLAGGLRRRSA